MNNFQLYNDENKLRSDDDDDDDDDDGDDDDGDDNDDDDVRFVLDQIDWVCIVLSYWKPLGGCVAPPVTHYLAFELSNICS